LVALPPPLSLLPELQAARTLALPTAPPAIIEYRRKDRRSNV
jgi:hypothetical protein